VTQHQYDRNSAGFSLVEVMVAILIMMIGMFGLLEAINASVQHNLRNQLRNEAVVVGQRYMAQLKGLPFDPSPDFKSYSVTTVQSGIRGVAKNYMVQRDSAVLAVDGENKATSRQLTVTVKYAYRNQSSLNRVVTVVPRP
jgi:type IV pilus assembly protein PilV